MNILMIGNKESGKTTYMASAFGLLEDGVSGFYIQTDNSTKTWFQKLFQEIKSGSYPNPTDKRSSFQFSLYYNQKKILNFNWIDYNGGVINETSIEKLGADIDKSEGMMIFLEAEALWKNKMSVHRFRRIIALIAEHLENDNVPLFSVIIVLTKYDRIPNHISLNDVTKLIQEFLDSAQSNAKLYTRVVPVSCTDTGFYNVELPLLDILDSGMKIEYLTAIFEAKAYAETAQEYASKTGLFNWAVSRLIGEKTNGELSAEYFKIAHEKITLYESIELPTQNLADYVSNYKIKIPQSHKAAETSSSIRESCQRFIEL